MQGNSASVPRNTGGASVFPGPYCGGREKGPGVKKVLNIGKLSPKFTEVVLCASCILIR
jgi:hypothetical protein